MRKTSKLQRKLGYSSASQRKGEARNKVVKYRLGVDQESLEAVEDLIGDLEDSSLNQEIREFLEADGELPFDGWRS